MKSWVGSRIRSDAEQVPCRYCHAIAGQQCVTKDLHPRPLEAFPAHTCRIKDAQKPQEEQ
jgi:hypothetical protein